MILGRADDPVDATAAKTSFRELLRDTPIPVVPVNLTSSLSDSAASTASNETFAVLESIYMNFTGLTERDELLREVKALWQSLLGESLCVHKVA